MPSADLDTHGEWDARSAGLHCMSFKVFLENLSSMTFPASVLKSVPDIGDTSLWAAVRSPRTPDYKYMENP